MHKEENDGGTPAPPASAPGLPTAAAARGGGRSKPAKRTGSTAVNKGRGPRGRGTLAGLLSAAVIVAAGGGLVAAASLAPQPSGGQELEVPLASVPAGMSQDVCPARRSCWRGRRWGRTRSSVRSPPPPGARSQRQWSARPGALLPGSRLSALDGSELLRIAKVPADRIGSGRRLGTAGRSRRPARSEGCQRPERRRPRQPAAGRGRSHELLGNGRGPAGIGRGSLPGAANDLWLTGANTAVGRSSVLHLTNASTTPATVSLELFGKNGQIKAPGSRGLLVGPGTTRSIVLAGLAPGQERLSVHARSTGGPVSAFIQQSVAPRPDPRRRRLHCPGNGTLGPPGHDRRRHPGRRRPGSSHRDPWLQRRGTFPANHRPRTRRRRGGSQALRPRRSEGTARRRCRDSQGRHRDRGPAGRSPDRPVHGLRKRQM